MVERGMVGVNPKPPVLREVERTVMRNHSIQLGVQYHVSLQAPFASSVKY